MGSPLKTPSTLDRYCSIFGLGLVALLFLCAGLAFGYFLYLRPLLEVRDAQTWAQVPCRILDSSIHSHSGKSTTYSLDVIYDYQVNGQSYQSNRFDFTTGSSSEYSWWEAAQGRHRGGSTDVCFVNPANPNEAVLERDFNRNPVPWIMAAIFGGCGLGLFIPVGRSVVRRAKFGESYLKINDAPVPLGGKLEGTIDLSRRIQPMEGFTLKLANIHHYITGAGKNQQVHEDVIWEESQQVMPDTSASVPVSFTLPVNGSETFSTTPRSRVLWRLNAKAKVPGVDFAAQFEVPVVCGALAQPGSVATTPEEQLQQPAHSTIKVQDTGNGREFYFPALRNPVVACSLLAFTAMFSLALWAILHFGAPLIFKIVFGFAVLFLGLSTAHEFFGTTRVVAGSQGLTVTKNLFGLGRTKIIPASDIREIRTAAGMTMSIGSNITNYYNVQVLLANGRKLTAGSEVGELQEAHWLALEMGRCTGLKH